MKKERTLYLILFILLFTASFVFAGNQYIYDDFSNSTFTNAYWDKFPTGYAVENGIFNYTNSGGLIKNFLPSIEVSSNYRIEIGFAKLPASGSRSYITLNDATDPDDIIDVVVYAAGNIKAYNGGSFSDVCAAGCIAAGGNITLLVYQGNNTFDILVNDVQKQGSWSPETDQGVGNLTWQETTSGTWLDFVKVCNGTDVCSTPIDSIKPTYSSYSVNDTSPKYNGNIKTTATLTDETAGGNRYFFYQNNSNTNSYENTSLTAWTSPETITDSINIADIGTGYKKNEIINVGIAFSDASGNWNQTTLTAVTISDTPLTNPTITTPTNNQRNATFIDIKGTCTDEDNDIVSFTYYLKENLTGTTNLIQNTTSNMFTTNSTLTPTDGNYTVSLICSAGGVTSNWANNVTFTYDTISPKLNYWYMNTTSINNVTILNNNTYILTTDGSFATFSYMISDTNWIESSQVICYNATGNTMFNYTYSGINANEFSNMITFAFSNYTNAGENFTCSEARTDSHTKIDITKDITHKIDNPNKKIVFDSKYESINYNNITIELLNYNPSSLEFNNLIVECETKKCKFGVNYTKLGFGVNDFTTYLRFKTTNGLRVVNNSEYKGHMVSYNDNGDIKKGGVTIDLENLGYLIYGTSNIDGSITFEVHHTETIILSNSIEGLNVGESSVTIFLNSKPTISNIILNSTYNVNNGNFSSGDLYGFFTCSEQTNNITRWYNGTAYVTELENQTFVPNNYTLFNQTWNFSAVCFNREIGDWSNSSQIYIQNTKPAVTLWSPANNSFSTSSVIFQAVGTDYDDWERNINLTNVTIYTNITGAWLPNVSVTSFQESSVVNLPSTIMPEGTLLWNALVCDSNNLCDYDIRNFTSTIDSTNLSIAFISETLSNGSFRNQSYIYTNVSISGTNFANVTYMIQNITNTNNIATLNSISYETQITEYNFSNSTLITNGIYNYTVIAKNKAGTDSVISRILTIDSLEPDILLMNPTESNNIYLNRNWIFVNVSINDTNKNATIFYLYNLTDLVTSTTYTDGTLTKNFTSLNSNTIYNYSVKHIDKAGNEQTTEVRLITLDSTAPSLSFVNPTKSNGTFVNQSYIYANISLTETNFANMTYKFENITTINRTTINSTTIFSAVTSINITNSTLIRDGKYNYSVEVYDLAGNYNVISRQITIDSLEPTINLISPANNTQTSTNTQILMYNVSDANRLKNCSLFIDNVYKLVTSNPTKDISLNFSYGFTPNTYNWSVYCYDEADNIHHKTNLIRIDVSTPTSGSTSGGTTSLFKYYINKINATYPESVDRNKEFKIELNFYDQSSNLINPNNIVITSDNLVQKSIKELKTGVYESVIFVKESASDKETLYVKGIKDNEKTVNFEINIERGFVQQTAFGDIVNKTITVLKPYRIDNGEKEFNPYFLIVIFGGIMLLFMTVLVVSALLSKK